MAANSQSTSKSTRSKPTVTSFRGGTSLALLMLVVIFGLLTFWAFSQRPRPDSLKPPSWQESLLYPREANAFQRLPRIRSALYDLFAVPDSEDLWVVGEAGLILYSPDNGLSWQQRSWPSGPTLDVSSGSAPAVTSLIQDLSRWLVVPSHAAAPPEPYDNNAPIQKVAPPQESLKSAEPTTPDAKKQASELQQQPTPQQQVQQQQQQVQQQQVAPSQQQQQQQQQQNIIPSQQQEYPVQQQEFPDQKPESKATFEPSARVFPTLRGVSFADRQHGWIVGDEGILLATQDGGLSWTSIDSGTYEDLRRVQFVDSGNGWVVGRSGTILNTQDGGRSWRPQVSNTRQDFNDLQFIDSRHGWVVGNRGTLLSTDDGGRTWLAMDTGSTRNLQALFFRDEQGWLVGSGGELLATQDSGKSWRELTLRPATDLNDVHFSSATNGWVVGDQGSIWRTQDGGQRWEYDNRYTDIGGLEPRSQGAFQRMAFRDAQRGWFVAEDGTIQATLDGGDDWFPQSLGYNLSLLDIWFSNEQIGWAVGGYGVILNTRDGGRSWEPQKSANRRTNIGVFFLNDLEGWACGEFGNLLHTQDGGQTWQEQTTPTQRNLYMVRFVDSRIGWAVGSEGTLLSTTDGGQSWQLRETGTQSTLYAVQFIDSLRGWIFAGRGQIGYTADGGLSWEQQQSDTAEDLIAAVMTAQGQGWVSGTSGLILRTDNFGQEWYEEESGVIKDLIGLSFNGNQLGWAVGTEGLILHTLDGGTRWQVQPSGSQQDLHRIHFQNAESGWIAASNGTLLGTQDGGQNWRQPEYDRYPAPWYWFSVLAMLGAGAILTSRKRLADVDTQSIVDVLASDRPWQPGDPDPLQFGRISHGLSRFLRNPATEPPLTLAITGEWGSGKSSLMNQLYFDLKAKGFNPVWFNAWHHQKGEQILASLYANIREQAVPRWTKFYGVLPIGLFFRLKLLFVRSGRRWMFSLILLALFTGSMSYLLSHPDHWQSFNWNGLIKSLKGGGDDANLLLAVLGAFPPLAYLFRALNSFGINPASLVVSSHGESASNKQMNPSARQRFAREFADVTRCLELGRMVIFIDDLDRCSKENVLEIMEVINFLSVSGNCYIVLGMAEEWVLTCIGLGFEELAKQSPMQPGKNDEEHLRDFARKYLEKLINISIPVPAIDRAGIAEIMTPQETEAHRGVLAALKERLRGGWERYHVGLSFVTAIALAISLGVYWKNEWFQQEETPRTAYTLIPDLDQAVLQTFLALGGNPETLKPTSAGKSDENAAGGTWELVVEATPEQASKGILLESFDSPEGAVRLRLRAKAAAAMETAESAPVAAPTGPDAGRDRDANRPRWPGFVAGAPDASLLDLSGLLLACLLFSGLLAWHWFKTEDRIAKDSPDFKKALNIWLPWIVARMQTPRQVKRHINRIRCVAMLNKPKRGEAQSRFGRWWRKLRGSESMVQPTTKQFQEEDLVALSAIELMAPEWVTSESNFQQLCTDNFDTMATNALAATSATDHPDNAALIKKLVKEMETSIRKHQKEFHSALFSDGTIRQRYLKFSVQPRGNVA